MSRKNLDRQGRLRNKMVSFRMSPEENEVLKRKIKLSGHTRQDYILNSVLDKDIIVVGNPYVFRSLHDELEHFIELYGTTLSSDDEEMKLLVLQMIKAMQTEKKTNIKVEMEPRQ